MAKIGVLAAPVTPFNLKDNSIDEVALERLFREILHSEAIDGIVPNAHAAEGAVLTMEERRLCLSVIKELNVNKKQVIACVIAESTKDAIKQAQDAKEFGCDAVMVAPPPIYAWSPDESPEIAIDFHKRITEESGMPMYLFVYPEGNPYCYSPATIKAILTAVPNFKAVKLTYKNIVGYQNAYQVIKSVNPEIGVLPTSPAMVFPLSCLKMVDGVLAGGANFVAEDFSQIIRLCAQNDYDGARIIHERVFPLAQALLAKPYAYLHSRYKYVAYIVGAIPNPSVRAPQLDISAEDKARLRAAAIHAGLKIVH